MKKPVVVIIIGLLIVVLAVLFCSSKNNTTSVGNTVPRLVQQVKESDDACPVYIADRIDNAQVTFLPVTIPINERKALEHDAIGKEFNLVTLSKGLYNYKTGREDLIEPYPWFIEDIDTHTDLGKIKIYYGNTAMNHTPHVAYVVKDNEVIFITSGANIRVERSYPNGLEVIETLDWNIGKYKRLKYEYVNDEFVPVWYQISCDVASKQE
ncbi:MAG: hypothetical protein AAB531_05300 [Patescibacteria group bacterium]